MAQAGVCRRLTKRWKPWSGRSTLSPSRRTVAPVWCSRWVVSGTIIPAGQWFGEVERSARAAFVVHVGGSIDDEHSGWARLFKGAAESVANDHAERRATREVIEGLPERYQRLVARQDQTIYIHLTEARVVAAGVSPLPAAGMHWRGRLSEISGGRSAILALSRPPLRRKTPITT
jgi:hypothetical protein